MPIFEYQCQKCDNQFELLVSSDTPIACPDCSSDQVKKLFSVFASHVKQDAATQPTCFSGAPGCNMGKCGSGLCGVE